MSTRWYPIYQRGGPQLRVYLPNFWLKLVRPPSDQPPNVVTFSCSMEMTKFDIRNYLEKIYNIKIADVRMRIAMGKTKRERLKGYVIKEDDKKLAYVILPKGEKFEFPDLFPENEKDKEDSERAIEETKKSFQQFLDKNKQTPNMPGWFSV